MPGDPKECREHARNCLQLGLKSRATTKSAGPRNLLTEQLAFIQYNIPANREQAVATPDC